MANGLACHCRHPTGCALAMSSACMRIVNSTEAILTTRDDVQELEKGQKREIHVELVHRWRTFEDEVAMPIEGMDRHGREIGMLGIFPVAGLLVTGARELREGIGDIWDFTVQDLPSYLMVKDLGHTRL